MSKRFVQSLMQASSFAAPVLLPALILACQIVCGCTKGDAAEETARADIVVIGDMNMFGQLERPAVQFPHDLHTEAMKERKTDCTACHGTQENGYLSPLFVASPANASRQQVMDLFHDKCIGCHNESMAAGLKAGPVACGDCHRRDPVYVSTRVPFGFDTSLHYRHLKANAGKCDPCHHIFDDKAKKLVYVEGKENPCRDCHREKTEENRSSFKIAAHEACIRCHQEKAVAHPGEPVGPQFCAGCHDLGHQQAIKEVENPPRLKRGQPDLVLLSVRDRDIKYSKLNTVPFSHVDHERFTTTCRVCHHETLSSCNECHTPAGDEKGSGVTTQGAMHDMKSDHSCIGCHQTKTHETQCAGCHDLMEQGRLSEHACPICHAGPPPEQKKAFESKLVSIDQFHPVILDNEMDFKTSDIPDSITIGVLAKEYRPAKMPHRKIIDTLRRYIKENKLATHFHGADAIMCQGCHHHGALGRRPALCENCHGKPFNESELFRPGLYGAYHRQCLGCHLSMNIQEESDCVRCHKKRENGESAEPAHRSE
jgi:hypothetical protein